MVLQRLVTRTEPMVLQRLVTRTEPMVLQRLVTRTEPMVLQSLLVLPTSDSQDLSICNNAFQKYIVTVLCDRDSHNVTALRGSAVWQYWVTHHY
jgi:hypothetical protein